jgi:ribose 5-phosphate isomerase B
MRIAVGTDEVTPVTEAVERHLGAVGHEVVAVANGDPWPDVGRRVGETVARGEADVGIVWCWTGTGVSIAANKVPGVRAALCSDTETADGARRWNDANVLALGIRLNGQADDGPAAATAIVDAFLTGAPDGTETENIAKLA